MDYVFIYLLIGVFAGLLAGLFGVGGGLVIVPVLVYLFTQQGFDHATLVHMAVGTSLATIIVTSLSSIYAHHKRGAVQWRLVAQLSPGIVLGALLGAWIADMMPAVLLRRVFAFFELLVGLQLLLHWQSKPARTLPALPGLILVSHVIGTISAIIGIGGGTMTVPFLNWCNIPMRQAVATSSAVGLPIAIAGTIGFVVMGSMTHIDVAWSVGYFYAPAFLGIVFASILFAPLGAYFAHILPAAVLKRLFGLFLILLSIYMFSR